MINSSDVIVIGTGGIGSSVLYHLTKSGQPVIGIDQFGAVHDRGSSHGQTRIIRKAYFEHPNYVPLLQRAYELWNELESEVNRQLYYETGLLQVGPEDGFIVPGVVRSANEHQLKVDRLTRAELTDIHPGFHADEKMSAVFEQQAGFLLVEQSIHAHLQLAKKSTAILFENERVVDWSATKTGVEVRTEKNIFQANQLVITAGAWTSSLFARLGLPLRVLRKQLNWFDVSNESYQCEKGSPAFFYETKGGCFYGFPDFEQQGLKVAQHDGGNVVQDPGELDRVLDVAELSRNQTFLQDYLPGAQFSFRNHATCMYTMTPDENFIVDFAPDQPNVVLVGGLSGHGFKFASVLGELVCNALSSGRFDPQVDFLGLNREALQ